MTLFSADSEKKIDIRQEGKKKSTEFHMHENHSSQFKTHQKQRISPQKPRKISVVDETGL